MTVAIAAAGASSRARQITGGGPKALIDIGGKPLVAHLLDRIREASALDKVVIVGGVNSPHGGDVCDAVRDYLAPHGARVALIESEARGVGCSLWHAARYVLDHGSDDLVFSVSDSIAERYRALSTFPVAVGVSPVPAWTGKTYTTVSVEPENRLGEPAKTPASALRAINGVYRVSGPALVTLESMLREALDEGHDPERFNSKQELRVTWVWTALRAAGVFVAAAELGELAEVNEPSDLERMRQFLAGRK